MTKLRGVYVGVLATVLESGRPVAPGDVVEVDSAGDDARIVPLLASVEPVEDRPAAKRRTPSKRRTGSQRQESDS